MEGRREKNAHVKLLIPSQGGPDGKLQLFAKCRKVQFTLGYPNRYRSCWFFEHRDSNVLRYGSLILFVPLDVDCRYPNMPSNKAAIYIACYQFSFRFSNGKPIESPGLRIIPDEANVTLNFATLLHFRHRLRDVEAGAPAP